MIFTTNVIDKLASFVCPTSIRNMMCWSAKWTKELARDECNKEELWRNQEVSTGLVVIWLHDRNENYHLLPMQKLRTYIETTFNCLQKYMNRCIFTWCFLGVHFH